MKSARPTPEADSLTGREGRAWLSSELARLAFETSARLRANYRKYRGERRIDQDAFEQGIEQLESRALFARSRVDEGDLDIQEILSIFALMHRLDHRVHLPTMKAAWKKEAKNQSATCVRRGKAVSSLFASRLATHREWLAVFEVEEAKLAAAGIKRPGPKAAAHVRKILGLSENPDSILRAVRRLRIRLAEK